MPNSCLYCRYFDLKQRETNLTSYYCKLKGGIIPGTYEVIKGCDKFVCYDKEEKEYDKKHKSHN